MLLLIVVLSGCGDLVATCSAQDVRLWNTKKGQELLRITVPNMVCNAIAIMPDGKSIVTGKLVAVSYLCKLRKNK